MTLLPEQQRRASAPYLKSRVRVGMVAVSAMDAGKDRLALSASCINDTAGRTGLRRIGGRNRNQPPASGLKFVVEHVREKRPALRENRPVQAALLGNAPVVGASGHLPDIQVFEGYDTEPPCDVRASDVEVVGSYPRDLRGDAADPDSLLGAALRPALPARQHLLRPASPSFQLRHVRQSNVFSRGEADRVGHAPVNADRRKVICGRTLPDVVGENDTPCASAPHHCHRFDRPDHQSSVPELDPAELGYFHGRPLGIETFDDDIPAPETRAVMQAVLPMSRKALAPKERGKCAVQVTQAGLDRRLRHCRDPIVFRAQRGQFSALARKADVSAVLGPKLAPEVAPLLQGQIVNQAHHADPLTERFGLLDGRVKVKAVASVHPEFLPQNRLAAQPKETGHD